MTQAEDLASAEKRIVELEVRYAHQEKLLSELSDVLYRQQQLLDQLSQRVKALESKFGELDHAPRVRDPKDEVPPHY